MNTAHAPLTVGALIDAHPVSGLQKQVIGLCAVSAFLDGFDVQALALVIPKMSAEMGVAPPQFAPAVSGSLIGMALGAMLLSPLADRFGRRPMMIAMLLLISLTTLGAAFAHSPLVLAAWRVLSGLGLGAIVPVAIAMTAEYAPARARAALITLMVSCTAVGAFSAGLMAPNIEALWGWRGIFGVGAGMPALAALLCAWALPESLRLLVQRHATAPGLQAQIDAQVRRIAPDQTSQVLQPEVSQAAHSASVRALFGPGLWQRTTLLWALFWVNLFVNYSLISWLPTLLTQAGWEHGAALRASGVVAIGGIAGSLLISFLADRGRTLPALIGAYALATVVLLALANGVPHKGAAVALLALVGMGAFGAQMALGSLTATYYPLHLRSTGVGWSSGFGRFGSFVGPLVLAGLMAGGASPSFIIGCLVAPMLLCLLCITLLPAALKTRSG